MNELETAVQNALFTKGNQQEANKAYLEFIKANFILPIEKNTTAKEAQVLYLKDHDHYFLPAFTNRLYFDAWASEIQDKILLLTLSGIDLLKGIGEHVTVSLNIGSPVYKEFNPSELARMRSMILKLFKTE